MSKAKLKETKTVSIAELRFADDETGSFEGYASVFGEPDSYGDTIKVGAFKKTIQENRKHGGPAMFLSHDPTEPIGVWDEMREDARGLRVKGRLVDTSKGSDVLKLLKAKALTGLSIGFRARRAERGPNGGRLLTDIELLEISLVGLPSASKARVSSVRHQNFTTADLAALTTAAKDAAIAMRKLK